MKAPIDLDNLSGLPQKFIEQLRRFDNVFMKQIFLEKMENDRDIRALIFDINNYCLKNRIIGYHFTRAIESDIIKSGLICRTGKTIRSEFIKRHFYLFTEEEKQTILKKWDERFDNNIENRDNRIFFNFTKHALFNGGAENLLSYYGGEQVYFPIFDIPEIGRKLKSIGIPLVLKCILEPSKLVTFIENPWGKIITSSYHRGINPNAHIIDQDGYQRVNVKHRKIEIIKYDKLF